MNESQNSKGGLQKALEISGDSHQYQITMIFCLTILWAIVCITVYGSAVIFNNPSFYCEGSEGIVVSQKEACELIKTKKCRTIENFSLTAQLQLYCLRQPQRTIIQSIYAVGAMIGLPIINLVSDTQGRKKSLILSMSCLMVGSIVLLVGSLINNLVVIYFGQFLSGTGSFTLMGLSFVISSDFCGDTLRQKSFIIFSCAQAFGLVFVAMAEFLKINWQIYIYCFILAPTALVTTFMCFYMFQSPYVLFNNNLRQQCLQSILAIAEVNQRDIHQTKRQIQKIVSSQPQKSDQQKASVSNILITVTKIKYLVPILILAFSIGLCDMNNLGLLYAMRDQGLGFAVNSALAGVGRFISLVIAYLYIEKIPRKVGIIGFYFTVFLLQTAFIWHGTHEAYVYSTIAIILSRVGVGLGYVLLTCLQVECFPVEIQSTAAGVIEQLSLYGFFVAPLVVEFGRQNNINPIALMGLSLLLVIFAISCIKETSYQEEKQQQNLSQLEEPPNNL